MNMISTILQREGIRDDKPLDIVWTPCDNHIFTNYVQSFGHRIYQYEHLYFGNVRPHLIICNNKMYSHQQVKMISLNYHLPVLVVDHTTRDPSVDLDSAIKNINNFKCSYKIAVNKQIFDSWGGSHDDILQINDADRQAWQNAIYNLAKRIFIL